MKDSGNRFRVEKINDLALPVTPENPGTGCRLHALGGLAPRKQTRRGGRDGPAGEVCVHGNDRNTLAGFPAA